MADHRKRFNRWRRRLPENTAYLVEQVLTRVVPEFEARGFVWYSDFAGGDTTQVGANDIPLQRRSGENWPTVQILFDKHSRPNFSVDFSELPLICKRWKDGAYVSIPREKALIVEAPAYFSLCKSPKGVCQYGYKWFTFFPRKHLKSEVDRLIALLPGLFELFDKGIPDDWYRRKFGYVSEHVLLVESRQDAFQ